MRSRPPPDAESAPPGKVTPSLTRRRLLKTALAGLVSFVAAPGARAARSVQTLSGLRLETGRPFAGDSDRLATIGLDDARRSVLMRFRLARPAAVTLEVVQTGQGVASERPVSSGQTGVAAQTAHFGPGEHALAWAPQSEPVPDPRTYILRLTADHAGRTTTMSAVTRVLGVDAAFVEPSSRQGTTTALLIRTDARSLMLQMLRCGIETEPTYANNQLNGVPIGQPRLLDWTKRRDAPASVYVTVGRDWPTGIYCARLDADDGRVGFAPVVVPPTAPTTRVGVVVPVSTWQAYNFYDANGDGWGDTWYARWQTMTVDTFRPHSNRGVPYRFRSYELGFYHWLAQRGIQPDFYADVDLELFASPDALRAAYDLLVFPGHTEYVTTTMYDLVEGFRDRGGNLLFLSANNFFRRVDRSGSRLDLIDEWRDLGRPEAGLCGVQYVASDRGERHGPFVVGGAGDAPWAFDGTGLQNGSTFGSYGIEIDARAAVSPPNTVVLASIPDLLGPSKTAEMTYYEHASGARVFSAGALNFGGQILLWPQTARLLENVWARLSSPA